MFPKQETFIESAVELADEDAKMKINALVVHRDNLTQDRICELAIKNDQVLSLSGNTITADFICHTGKVVEIERFYTYRCKAKQVIVAPSIEIDCSLRED